jgi:hypothetical protein
MIQTGKQLSLFKSVTYTKKRLFWMKTHLFWIFLTGYFQNIVSCDCGIDFHGNNGDSVQSSIVSPNLITNRTDGSDDIFTPSLNFSSFFLIHAEGIRVLLNCSVYTVHVFFYLQNKIFILLLAFCMNHC